MPARPWVVRLGNAYVEVFRNVPLIVQMFLVYLALPQVAINLRGQFPGIPEGFQRILTLEAAVAGIVAGGAA